MKWNKILFVILIAINSLGIGMIGTATLGMADGQGLAGGAVILFNGIIFSISVLILTLIFLKRLSDNIVKQLNRYLVGLLIIFVLLFLYRLNSIVESATNQSPINQKTTID